MPDDVPPLVRCPVCSDEHTTDERDDVDGRKLCPECGHEKAIMVDERPGVTAEDLEVDRD